MVQSQFAVSWDSYKSSICNGFSSLQQNGEFVDMTIAADGHLVKVHQMLIALASPYLKNLISSAPCQHPVIFLNNVSHRVLCLLLEYVYTGEVVVPAEYLTSFAETAKSLHIRGLEDIGNPENLPVKMSGTMPQLDDSEMCHVSGIKRISTDKMGQIGLPASARKIYIKKDPSVRNKQASDTPASRDDLHEYPDMMEDSGAQDSDEGYKHDIITETHTHKTGTKDKSSNLQFTVSIRGSLQVILNRYIYNLHSSTSRSGMRRWRCVDYRNNKCTAFVVTKGNIVLNSLTVRILFAASNLQYTVSIRGSLQVILNRYLYNLHSSRSRSGMRRWRCVDYRDNKCTAFVVTKGNIVINRANLHNHSFHDKKILSKIEKNAVFSAIDEVQGYKEREESKITDRDISPEQEDFSTVEVFDDGKVSKTNNEQTSYKSVVRSCPDMAEDSGTQDSDYGYNKNKIDSNKKTVKTGKKYQSSNLQFSVSIRGSLQVILDRYIYNLNSSKAHSGLRQWRCVEYRNHKCTAFVVTKGNTVIKKDNCHNHSYHDMKILAKIEKRAVFSTINEVQGYKEREESNNTDVDTSTENDEFLTV